jgi:hypothetical protein
VRYLLLLLLALPVRAEIPAAGLPYIAYGGELTCTRMIRAYNRGVEEDKWGQFNMFVTYADGYITSIDRYTNLYDAVYGLTEQEQMRLLLDYCRAHRDDKFYHALDEVIHSLVQAHGGIPEGACHD